VFLLLLARWGANLYVDWLWFQSLGYAQVFTTILLSEIGLRFLVGIAAFIFILVNLTLTRKAVLQRLNARQYMESEDIIAIHQSPLNKFVTPRLLTLVYVGASLLLGLFASTAVTGDWVILQKFLHQTSFGFTDPIFNNDVGKYVFELPFQQFIYRLLTLFIVMAAMAVAAVYFLTETGGQGLAKVFNSLSARLHLSFLAALFFLVRAWGYRLEQYMLLYSPSGVVAGPGYTDINARLLAFKALMIIALLIAVLILVNLFLRRFKLIIYGSSARHNAQHVSYMPRSVSAQPLGPPGFSQIPFASDRFGFHQVSPVITFIVPGVLGRCHNHSVIKCAWLWFGKNLQVRVN